MKRIILTISLLFIFSLSSLAQKDAATATDEPARTNVGAEKITVPMDAVSRKPIVDVKINGKGPFRFFLDTGSSATVLDQSLADELSLEKAGTTLIGDPNDPQGIKANKNLIKTLAIGKAEFYEMIAVSWDRTGLYPPGGPRGVLGMPLFKKLMLTIDYPNNNIVIERGELKKGSDVIAYTVTEGGVFSVPLKVGKSELSATLDSGSSGGLSFPSDYMERLALTEKPREVGRARTVGGEAVIYGSTLKEQASFGGQAFDSLRVDFFERLRTPNLGHRILSKFSITIDQQKGLMRFVPQAPVTATAAISTPAKEYVGTYGFRRISIENGELHIQRLSGPQGAGPLVKLTEVSKDTFSIEGVPGPRVKFTRDQSGKVTELQVQNPAGEWESTKRDS